MERYKQERDAARSRIDEVEKELVQYKSEQETLTKQLQEYSRKSEIRLVELQLKMEEQQKSLAKTADYEARMRRYHEERNKAMFDNGILKKQLATLEDTISDLRANIGHKDSSGCVQTLTDDLYVDAEIEKPQKHNPGHQDLPPGSPRAREDYQPQLYGIDKEHGERLMSTPHKQISDFVVCPLCQLQVLTARGGDALQLHYLTSCSGYDCKGRELSCFVYRMYIICL